jgi:hypothetical protein
MEHLTIDGEKIRSFSQINVRGKEVMEGMYGRLVPDEIYSYFSIDRETFENPKGEKVVSICAPTPLSVVIEVRLHPYEMDTIFKLHLDTTPNNQIEIVYVSVSNPFSERFDVDRDESGNPIMFGTSKRNRAEEERAMRAGLAPGQVRQGLKLLSRFLPQAELFFASMGYMIAVMNPLAYHDAILFEKYGCGYLSGRDFMENINDKFSEGGEFCNRLDNSTFRKKGQEKTVRGRSWAIYDGILGHPFKDIKMYRQAFQSCEVSTFGGAGY